MATIFKVALCVIAISIQSCVHFATAELDNSFLLAVEEDPEKGELALEFNKGIIDDFNGELHSWWGADGITLVKKSDTLKVTLTNVGSKYIPFGREFTSLDFTKNNAIRIRMRAEGKIAPTVRLDLKDHIGITTNATAVQVILPVNKEYKDYYFNYKDKWSQVWPDVKNVDPNMVSALMFFINPGMNDWTGTLYIDEIVAIHSDSIPKKQGSVGGMVDNFEEDPSSFWWTGSSKIVLEKMQDADVMKITSNGAGANYETFGRSFDQADFTKAPIIRMRARAENATGFTSPKVRFAIKDKFGYVANEFELIETIEAGTEFKDYFFNFTDKYSQTYPSKHTVNPTDIRGVILFINSGGPAYSGIIYVDEIEIITKIKYEELKNNK